MNGGNQQSQSTFAGLSDFVHDIFGGSQTSGTPGLVGHIGNSNDVQGQGSKFGGSPRRIKHLANRKGFSQRIVSASKEKEQVA